MKKTDWFFIMIIILFALNLLTINFTDLHWMDITALILSIIALALAVYNLYLRWRINREK